MPVLPIDDDHVTQAIITTFGPDLTACASDLLRWHAGRQPAA